MGGFHAGLKSHGLICKFASDIDPHATESYHANFGIQPHGDITQIAAESIPPHDLLCGGFPCQSFSISGDAKGFDDPRGQLFYEIIRIAEHHQPKAMILENVKNILTIDGGETLREIKNQLKGIGYHVSVVVLNATDFCVPQFRERVYFVAVRKNAGLVFKSPHLPMPLEIPIDGFKVIADIALPDCETADLVIQNAEFKWYKKPPAHRATYPLRIGGIKTGGHGHRIYSELGVAVTQMANGGGRGAMTGLYLINGKVRKLHITESKRVMGFDDAHVVSEGKQGYKQMGNAVVPPVITALFGGIQESGRGASDGKF